MEGGIRRPCPIKGATFICRTNVRSNVVISGYKELKKITITLQSPVTWGESKTCGASKRILNWRGMVRGVHKYIQACGARQRRKDEIFRERGLFDNSQRILLAPPRPLGKLCVAGLPKAEKGYNLTKVFIDRLSKRIMLIPGTSVGNAETVAFSG